MDNNSRMKEITGNLKRDMRDLLNESASIMTGFFKRGVCTVRAVADKWRTFTQDISTAVDELMKPPFLENGPDAPLPSMKEGAEPIVTVTGSIDRNFPIGKQMLFCPEFDPTVALCGGGLWECRIGIVATMTLIHAGKFDVAIRNIERLLHHPHDLIRKANGWMLREIGKKDESALLAFLDCHAATMPRTALRYAVERLSPEKRRHYMGQRQM